MHHATRKPQGFYIKHFFSQQFVEICRRKIMRRYIIMALTLAVFLALLSIWVMADSSANSKGKANTDGQGKNSLQSTGDLLQSASIEYNNSNYMTASRLYKEAYKELNASGDMAGAREALNRHFLCDRMVIEYPHNYTTARTIVDETFPQVPAGIRSSWLEKNNSQQIETDHEIRYYENTVKNIRFHNLYLIRNFTLDSKHNPFFDEIRRFIFSNPSSGIGPYLRPTAFEVYGNLSIPKGLLPKMGTLRLWIPMPIETSPQSNVTVLSIEPSRYVRQETKKTSDIGIIYMVVPLDGLKDDVNVSVKYGFTQHEQRFNIDPSKVRSYNTSSEEYKRYTRSEGSEVFSPEMAEKAREIVGNESNPYLQAKKLYNYIITTFSYSNVPHASISARGLPESVYMATTGFGDCGTQSVYFAALCRSLGIPARATGGLQLVPGLEGDHFWAEFYLEGYGWVPVDVTIAESADWAYNATDEERSEFKDYYFGNLDPYRMVIQKDTNIPFVPDPGDAEIFGMVLQIPTGTCNTSSDDIESIAAAHWKWDVRHL
jgi:transglutaminase-like putative cysteine protease